MSYEKRLDGRKFDELRPISAKAGVIPRADGSAYFKMGKTEAYAAVYGPRNLFPKFMQDPEKGILRCRYNMMPFSGAGERVRPGGSRRSKEISMVTEKALLPVLDLSDFPNSVVDVFIELSQTDAGSRCAGICAAAIALADAGLAMRDLPVAVAVGKVDDRVLVDLNYEEEAFEGEVSDIPVCVIPRNWEISLLQMDGEIKKEQLMDALSLLKKAVPQIHKIQRDALREKFRKLGEGIEEAKTEEN
ncbi:MAG: exosome complex exonuclease Rrp41 [Candidatus Woesearchaeota archaeon]|nr:exosome complex exonuclease Rrp41 [Candidatus Woesearchaeota archaeon]